MSNYYTPGMPLRYTEEEIDEMLSFLDRAEEADPDDVTLIECECGAEKTYGESALHSDWCPKAEEE